MNATSVTAQHSKAAQVLRKTANIASFGLFFRKDGHGQDNATAKKSNGSGFDFAVKDPSEKGGYRLVGNATPQQAISYLRVFGNGGYVNCELELASGTVLATHDQQLLSEAMGATTNSVVQKMLSEAIEGKESILPLFKSGKVVSVGAQETLAIKLDKAGATAREIIDVLRAAELAPPAKKALLDALEKRTAPVLEQTVKEQREAMKILERTVKELKQTLIETENERGRLTNGEQIYR